MNGRKQTASFREIASLKTGKFAKQAPKFTK